MLSVESAISIFLDSFACTRSIARRAEVVKFGPFHAVRDVAREGDTRREEIVVPGSIAPEDIAAAIAEYKPRGGYMIDVYIPADADPKETILAVKSLGCRFMRSEPLMVRSTCDVPAQEGKLAVRTVESPAEAARVDKAAGQRQMFSAGQEDRNCAIRVYYIEEAGSIVAWGRDVLYHAEGAYVAGMYTYESHRRQGLATQILRKMLADDAVAGAEYSVLLASRAGEKLYLTVGYVQIGTLLMFTPSKKR